MPPAPSASPMKAAESESSDEPITGSSVCGSALSVKKTANGTAARTIACEREQPVLAGARPRRRSGRRRERPAGTSRHATMTPTPISAPTTCATRQPARAGDRAADRRAERLALSSAPSRSRPSRSRGVSGGALVANTVIPVVLVSADAAPRKNTAHQRLGERARRPASSPAERATPTPVAASAGPGGSRSASRPAGRSITSRPSANAVVIMARSAAVSRRSRPISGSSGARMNDATATASTTPPASRVGPEMGARRRHKRLHYPEARGSDVGYEHRGEHAGRDQRDDRHGHCHGERLDPRGRALPGRTGLGRLVRAEQLAGEGGAGGGDEDLARAGGQEVRHVGAAGAAHERRDALLEQQALHHLRLGLVARPTDPLQLPLGVLGAHSRVEPLVHAAGGGPSSSTSSAAGLTVPSTIRHARTSGSGALRPTITYSASG